MSAPPPVRVRFAPSPTGWLHVGGARTAYFNWLFARKHGGVFVLRVEDTDVERSSETSERGVLDDLAWLGLEWDEGPDRGGPFGPYRQSERLTTYHAWAERLTAQGAAYPCFCTDAELEARRQAALAAGRPPQYDGRCRRMSIAEREAARAEGRPESIRFGVESRDWVLQDLVRGEVRFPGGMVGDFVLLRSSGLPTYNFACVVDDASMQISHVLRAEEHLPNTARQLMLYAAFAIDPPAFAHVPLILNADRTKMSKRSGEAAVAVGDWRRDGFVAEALLSYLALLGFHPGDDREILSRPELIEAFDLARVGRSGSVFDPDKLRWVNAHYLHHASGETLHRWADAFLPEAARAWPTDRLEAVLGAVRGNLATLADLSSELAPFMDGPLAIEPEAAAVLVTPNARALCGALALELESLAEWSGERFKSAVQTVGRTLGLKGRELFQPPRAALTGRTHGPELPMVAELLGRDRSLARLRAAEEIPDEVGVKVAVLMGGRSSEREISLRTGRGIAHALRNLGHDVVAIDAANGLLLPAGEEERAALPSSALEPQGEIALSRPETLAGAEVILIALHGAAGENGTLQALLDLAGKPYTGSGMMASALAMNKAMAKRLFEHDGIPTPAWRLLPPDARTGSFDPADLGGLPLVVKPNEEGSSVGLTVVEKESDLAEALRRAGELGEILVEAFIPGRELTVAMLGDRALPIVEIRPKGGLYDYESKYTAGKSEYFCPADLPRELTEQVQDLGRRAAAALGCRGVSRVDFRLDARDVPYCLEVNTVPGMTPTSLVPMAAKAVGMSYDQVVQAMIDLAIADSRRRLHPTSKS